MQKYYRKTYMNIHIFARYLRIFASKSNLNYIHEEDIK